MKVINLKSIEMYIQIKLFYLKSKQETLNQFSDLRDFFFYLYLITQNDKKARKKMEEKQKRKKERKTF